MSDKPRPITSVPSLGDELRLVRLEADPKRYIGEEFVIVGVVSSSSYYNYGYNNAEDSHYSLSFTELDESGQSTHGAHLYVPRTFSDLLIEKMTSAQESGADGILTRAKVTLNADRYDGASSWDLLEVLDWQFFDREAKRWRAWSLDGFVTGLKLLSGIGELEPIISILESPKFYGNEVSDTLVRQMAAKQLLEYPISRADIIPLVDLLAGSGRYGSEKSDEFVRTVVIVAMSKSEEQARKIAYKEMKKEYYQAKRAKNEVAQKWLLKGSEAFGNQ